MALFKKKKKKATRLVFDDETAIKIIDDSALNANENPPKDPEQTGVNELPEETNNTPATPQEKTIVCIQLDKEPLAAVKKRAGDSFKVVEFNYLDEFKIKTQTPLAHFVVISWQSEESGKRSEQMIKSIKQLMNKTAILIVIKEKEKSGQIKPVRGIPADHWLDLPSDVPALAGLLYDFRRRELLTQKSSTVDPEKLLPLEIKEITFASGALSELKNSWQQEIKRRKKTPSNGDRWVVIDSDAANGAGLARSLKGVGFREATSASTVEELLERYYIHGVDGLIIWFDKNRKGSLEILQAITERRELYRVPTAILIPGQGALQELVANSSELFVDKVAILDRFKLKKIIKETQEAFLNQEAPKAILEEVRQHWRTVEKGNKNPLRDDKLIKEQINLLTTTNGKEFWGELEECFHAIQTDTFNEEMYKQVKYTYRTKTSSLTASMLFAEATSTMESQHKGNNWLLKRFLTEKEFTHTKYWQIAQYLSSANAEDELHTLLTHWMDTLSDTNNSPEFWHATGCYNRIIGRHCQERDCLFNAIQLAPLRGDFLIELATHFETCRDYHYALDAWTMAASSRLVDKAGCNHHRIKCMIKLKKLKKAKEVAANMLEKYPKNTKIKSICKMLGVSSPPIKKAS